MREIVIKTVYREHGSHVVRLGNGTIHKFTSEKSARKFLAETNRFLTAKFFESNQILSELYSHVREIWIISPEIKERHQLDDQVHVLEATLKRSYSRSSWAAGNYFTFIDHTKFCQFAKVLIKFLRNVRHVSQTDTLRRHRLDRLFDQVHGIEMQLMNYGQLQAYEHFSTSKLNDINDTSYSERTHLRIA